MEAEKRQKAEGGRQKSRTRVTPYLVIIFAFCLPPFAFFTTHARAQAGRRLPSTPEKKSTQERPAEAKPAATPAAEAEDSVQDADDEEAVRVETNLVTLTVVASDRPGRYVPDMKAEEFSVSEDGVEQKLAFFAAVSEPFNVVLLLDTSASTTVEKMRQVQEAAVAFTRELREGDRMKVVSFDDEVRDLCDFTSDRDALAAAIRSTRPGRGTRLYDAFDLAHRALRRQRKGRKAVLLLTDGVDYRSERRTFDDNRRAAEESDVVVYPVRFDTREETERLARAQARGGRPVDLGTVLGGRVPGLPPGSVIINPRGGTRTEPEPTRRSDGLPDITQRHPDDRTPGASTPRNAEEAADAGIRAELDLLYRTADDYLRQMALTTGGNLLMADNPALLPAAFRKIAEELRTQYSLGYYPSNTARDGKYRKIRVRTTRKDIALRTRPGYRARR
jgi:VWFA-related protein